MKCIFGCECYEFKPKHLQCPKHYWFHIPLHKLSQVVVVTFANSSPPSATYILQWIEAALVEIMACRLNQLILIKIQNFSFTKMHPKISSAKWRPFCPGGDELSIWDRKSTKTSRCHHHWYWYISSNTVFKTTSSSCASISCSNN